ncbi:MAG: SDR family oxidoreductase, partial [Magnetovibrio sp.]|nr:SDR family oxidoreductase [Magnetovibrio sp.]
MKDIEDFKIGDRASLKHRITATDVERFVDLTGDDNPLHVDQDFAEKSPMKGIVTHGMLSASFISTIIGKHLPGPGALWVSQSIEFLAPVRLNDELDVQAEIVEIHVKQRLIKLNARITNQRGKEVLTGECLVKVLASEKKAPIAKDRAPGCVIVTGSSRGIGAAIATRLSQQGIPVIINCRDETGGQRVADQIHSSGGTAHVIKADITDPAQVEHMITEALQKFGTIQGLVNNAAPSIIEKSFGDLSWDECAAQFNAQVGAAFNCIQMVAPHMKANHGGSIVNIGSIVSDQSPPPTWMAYNLAKAGLHALTHNLAEVLGPDGIRINTVAPGLTDTRFITEIAEKARILTKMQTPLRRLAQAEDIAATV